MIFGSSDMSPYVKASKDVLAIEEAFVFPHGLTALAPTTTKFGITSKDLIGMSNSQYVCIVLTILLKVATNTHKIQTFPRRILDPRRPHRKVTAEEAEEGLFQYEPLIPDDPKRVISHTYEVESIPPPISSRIADNSCRSQTSKN